MFQICLQHSFMKHSSSYSHLAHECSGRLCCVRCVGYWVPQGFFCWASLVLLPFSPHPFIHRTLPGVESYPVLLWQVQHHEAAERVAFKAAYFLQLRSFEVWPGFCLAQVPMLIQVLGTSLICFNVFKSHSGTERFDCEQINPGDCLVFVQCLEWWISALGINIFWRYLQVPCRSTAPLQPSPPALLPLVGSDISTVLIPRKDLLLPCPGKELILLKLAWKNITRSEAEFHPNINRVECPRISFWSKSCSAVESPKYQ